LIFSNALVGWIPGGLAHTNILNSMIFAGMSGSTAADASGLGLLEYRAMVKRGFEPAFTAALSAASAVIGPIIPPSIPVIVYTMVVPDASVGKLFLAGIVPGIFMAIVMMIYVYFEAKRRNYPREKMLTRKDFGKTIRAGILPILTPLVLLTTTSTGIVTISEGAVITVLYTIFLGVVIYRQFGWKHLIQSIKTVSLAIGSIMIMFMASKMFSYVLAKENLIGTLSSALHGFVHSKVLIMLIINVFFLLAGCLSDALVNIMLFAPLAWSVAAPLGIDPNAFGMIVIFNCMLGLLTPPVGGNVFLMSSLTGVPMEKIFKEAMPYVIGFLLILVFMSMFPGTVSFLPNLIMK
jgi:tripartite ATP-independent transporter DctM subunit